MSGGHMLITLIAICTFVAMLLHELGHLKAAKLCQVPASELSIGLGPKVCGFRMGSVMYSLRLFPLGSFVRLNSAALHKRPVKQQLFIHLAGIIVNLIVSIAAYGTLLGQINLLLAIANLLPIYQHDGWKCGVVLARAFLQRQSRPVEWTFTFSGGVVSLLLINTVLRLFG